MEAIMPINKQCPSCENGYLILTKEILKLKVDKIAKKGYWYIYRCDNCGEGFTTTNSDTLSIKNFQSNKKSKS
jgi:uncharacterized Zn finger protein